MSLRPPPPPPPDYQSNESNYKINPTITIKSNPPVQTIPNLISSIWPHQLYIYDLNNTKGTSWENLPKETIQKELLDQDIKYPTLSLKEIDSIKPDHLSIFCPIEWKWLIIIINQNQNHEPLMNLCQTSRNQSPPAIIDQEIGIQIKPKSNGIHFFEVFKNLIETGQIKLDPISIFDNSDENYLKEKKLGWDLCKCIHCDQTIIISPLQNSIDSIFPKVIADALTQQARVTNTNHQSNSNGERLSPEQAVYKAWHTVFIVIQNALIEGKLSPLPLDGKSISVRMPWTPTSQKIWSCLGAERREGSDGRPILKLPSLNVRTDEGRKTRAKWVRALIEVSVFLRHLKLKHPHVLESYKTSYQVPLTLKPANEYILEMLGGDNIPRTKIPTNWKKINGIHPAEKAYQRLGLIPETDEEVLIYSYKLQSSIYPIYQYLFFQSILDIYQLDPDNQILDKFVRYLLSKGAVGLSETKESWNLICGPENQLDLENEELIATGFNQKLELADQDMNTKLQLRNALKNLVFANPSNQLLRALLDSTSTLSNDSTGSGIGMKNEMDLEKAYSTLGDVVPETDDEFLWVAYMVAISDQPGQKKVLKQAIETIAKHRNSELIKNKLLFQEIEENGSNNLPNMDVVPYSPPTMINYDLPAGLNNIGNTCYLNSLLQYFFSVRELREVLLRFPEYAQELAEVDDEPEKEWKRVGGRVVSKPEVARSKQFASQLQNLFQEMITTKHSAVTPERELAFLALVIPKEESTIRTDEEKNKNHQNANDSSASTDATLVDDRSTFIGPMNNPHMTTSLAVHATSPSSTVLGKRKSESSDTEDDLEMCVTRDVEMEMEKEETTVQTPEDINMAGTTPIPIPVHSQTLHFKSFNTSDDVVEGLRPILPSRAQTLPINKDETNANDSGQEPIVIDLTDEVPNAALPPPLPPRPNRNRSLAVTDNGSHMMFGRQNDVSECMDNCLFQIQAALDETKLSASVGEEGNIVKSLFYGRTRQSLVFGGPEGKISMKEEPFAYLLVDVAEEGRDLYDALDRVFDESEVDVEDGKAIRRVGLVHLPPILQIQLQRVQFDRSTHTVFKSNAYLKFEEKLRMDRYLEPEPDDEAGIERRARTLGCRKEIESLRCRVKELTANVAGGKRTSSALLRDLHTILNLTTPIPTLAEFFGDLIGPEEVNFLATEADAIEEEVERVNKRVAGLKEEVEEMWKMESRQGCEYRLVSLFMHRGTASGGHYWAIQRQLPENVDRWLKYNDSVVSVVDPMTEVFNQASTDGCANPYWLTYVRVGEETRFEMLKREVEGAEVQN
ncbi:hypothetical protein CROQUDRAFT_44674 [Cronartium quercuum f. sp. fusiforme G11]|uniref:ubiquitinyl hydrolase 1 n=1 Tax=Cronartium quercuum f. sp. fusiforme G11 TaxID=708437 RepID=A0A9P6NIH3_9BASI|nr:hypothetical protein CROQUDRAFT_44674 [Cronartium quercuum f. sp. fusiforme G11]